MDCLFCKLAAHEIPAEIVDEDDRALAFLDIHPQAPGHTVVIPKYHAAKLSDLPLDEVAPLFKMVRDIAKELEHALGTDGLTIGVNQGEVSGQTVPHLHIHLFPRFKNDGGSSVHRVVNNPPKESLKEIAAKIRAAA